MAYMARFGWRNPGSLIPWPASFFHTASTTVFAIVASSAPPRIIPRTSVSVWEKRHVRILPSAVMRIRSQAKQKGSETLAMTPMSPLPS